MRDVFKVSEIQLVYKHSAQRSILPYVKTPYDAFNILFNQWDENRLDLAEDFKVLLLNRANQAIGICPISSGGIAGTVADPKLIFAAAIKAAASSIILAHNHPSGNLKPSEVDISLTKRLQKGGLLLDICVPDHIILTSAGFYSIASECTFNEPCAHTPYAEMMLPILEY